MGNSAEQDFLASRYDSGEVEQRWVDKWANEPLAVDLSSEKPPFSIVMPPPNVTGALHLGHAFDNTIIDTVTRYKRMRGYETLLQPGTDHAGISTQIQVERALREEGTDRHEIGRETFLERMWEWRDQYGGIILEQLQRLGVSADWTRTRFTMDEGLSAAVRKQFVRLYHEGKVYRGERIVNWDPASQTVLSDLEVDREERPSSLFHLAYRSDDGREIVIATQRPETIFADVAVAVHPEDERYADLVGMTVTIPLTDRSVPVITDAAVEKDFGTGALKITPAHDQTDFEIGERHNLPRPAVIDTDAKLTSDLVPERFRGMDRFEGRDAVVAALREEGFLVDETEHVVPLALSERTGEVVEPLVMLQWFYDASDAAARALQALQENEIQVTPERYRKVNTDWLENLRPWCISRQLWWGHRIPAWYDEDGNVHVPSLDDPYTDPTDNPALAHLTLTQDEDVFDTWFSSNLWPFSTLGWPDENDPAFQKFYPTSLLVTGYDIIFFWVARMELAGYEFTGERPFDTVLLHGLVLDQHGQKMSKSKGNGVDPLDVIAESGADALRFALARASTGSQDIRWDDRLVTMGRNFATKLWNAARFVQMQLGSTPLANVVDADEVAPQQLVNRWIVSRLNTVLARVNEALDEYDLGAANRLLYDFVWSEFCDWYLEAAKVNLRAGDEETKTVLAYTLHAVVKMLHPMIPFVTAELYTALGGAGDVARSQWPAVVDRFSDEAAEREFVFLEQVTSAIRNLRTLADRAPGEQLTIQVLGTDAERIIAGADIVGALSRSQLVNEEPAGPALKVALPGVQLALEFAGEEALEQYLDRQQNRLAKAASERARSEKKLSSEKFVQNAPTAVVEEERRRLAEAEQLVTEIQRVLSELR